jgi:hypothetical protein
LFLQDQWRELAAVPADARMEMSKTQNTTLLAKWGRCESGRVMATYVVFALAVFSRRKTHFPDIFICQ